MRAAPMLVSVLLLVSCSLRDAESRWVVAVGWRGTLPAWNGPCDPGSLDSPSVMAAEGGSLLAKTEGTARFRCQHGVAVYEVRAPARVRIEAPARLRPGEPYVVELVALDGNGQPVALGDAEVAWEISAPLRAGARCDHMLGSCLPSRDVKLIADAPGVGSVRASWQGRQASASIVVE